MVTGFDWQRRRVTVTGGASFIGSHLVDALVSRGCRVRVVDDLSSGKLENLGEHVGSGAVEFIHADLSDLTQAREALAGSETIFHLAAVHGGRGYVDLHAVECAANLVIDGIVFKVAHEFGVEKVVYASSGCVYPNYLQGDPSEEVYLTEAHVGPPFDSDNIYGYAKLMGEMALQAYCCQTRMKGVSCRYFTVYGPRGVENHAIIAMIARAFLRQNPFEVWGNGQQVRNWTYIDDIVSGTIAAAEQIDDGRAVNLGTMERIRVVDAAQKVMQLSGHRADMRFLPHMPTGPMNRVADNSLARQLLGWSPSVAFDDGLRRTVEWYFGTKDREDVSARFHRSQLELR